MPSGALDPATAVSAGFAVVVQDVRGTGTSGGSFEPYVNEADDGFDTIAWVAAQPWCDGRVVMSGMSYVGVVQWLAASRRPPALVALTPTITTDSLAEGWSFRSGVLESGFLRTLDRELAGAARSCACSTTSMPSPRAAATSPRSRPGRRPGSSSRSTLAYWAARGPAPGSVLDGPARARDRRLVRLLPRAGACARSPTATAPATA